MNSIKVFFQYPLSRPDSPFYEYLFDYPPENIEFINPLVRKKKIITESKSMVENNLLKAKIKNFIFKSKLPIPNVRYTLMTKEADIIHAAHCLSLNNYNWVCDFETWTQPLLCNIDNRRGIWLAKKILKRKNCKSMIFWTEETKKRTLEMLGNDQVLLDKSVVIYPAVPVNQNNSFLRKNQKPLNLLFVARDFQAKGGDIVVKVMDRLTKRYGFINGIIVSSVPEDVKNEYSGNSQITFYDLMPREKLQEIYSICDIFIYPGISDTFGFGFLEAMSYGMPIVTGGGYARREIVKNGYNGFVCKTKFLKKLKYPISVDEDDIFLKIEKLIIDNKLREKLGTNGFRNISIGKFSIQERNKKLRDVYFNSMGYI